MISPRRKPRAYSPDPDAPGQVCDVPGCGLTGEYRAPKSRSTLREFHWFCLDHVREYNASWDYYKGMSPGEIEAQLRSDTSWQRPSWPLGSLGHAARMEQVLEHELSFTFGSETGGRKAGGSNAGEPPKPKVPGELREALEVLGLVWPVSMDTVKSTYKKLAKRHHPDANGGNKASEEILKAINLAYATLRSKLADKLSHPPQPAAE